MPPISPHKLSPSVSLKVLNYGFKDRLQKQYYLKRVMQSFILCYHCQAVFPVINCKISCNEQAKAKSSSCL